MVQSTFDDIAEVSSKTYSDEAKLKLEDTLTQWSTIHSTDEVKKLGLPQILMFLSSCIAKANNHDIINAEDVKEATSLLQYLLFSDFVVPLIKNNSLFLGFPQTDYPRRRFKEILSINADFKIKNQLNQKIDRLTRFLENQNLKQKHINRIVIELRATIILLARLRTLYRSERKRKLTPEDIDISYDISRHLMLKLDPVKPKILKYLNILNTKAVWKKIPKINFDQSTHDHLSNTAYGRWENQVPGSFEALKKKINCGARPFLSAILGFCELYGASHELTRISTQELGIILEQFEKFAFGKDNPLFLEEKGLNIKFTEESLQLLENISKKITEIIVSNFGKDEYVFRFSSTVSRQISLLLFIALVEQLKRDDQKIIESHLLFALRKWTIFLIQIKNENVENHIQGD